MRHGPYAGVSGWFSINSRTAVVAQPGKHDWPYASRAFATALPWLAGRLHTPEAPQVPLPNPPPSTPIMQTAAR